MHMMMLQDTTDYVSQVVARWGPGPRMVMSYGADTESGSSGICWLLVLGEVSVLIAGTIASTLGPT